MKKLVFTSVLAFLFALGGTLSGQNHSDEYLGLPGDNLNLFAVMSLFQESETLEAFERGLNDPENMINNLDLNGDNLVDYIMVHDYVDGNIHTIVLRVALNRNEFQDVAVFTVEKLRNGAVRVQLIGDEALYGPNYIIEPNYAERPNPGYRGNVVQQQQAAPRNTTVVHTTYYDVARWPVIVYLSRPSYRPWRSAWYWGYHPAWWNPWTPHYWHYYHGYHYNWHTFYVTHFRPWHIPRSVRYKTVYVTRIRHYSPTVIVNVNQGVYRDTYSRPEKRAEGEVRFAQRHAVDGTTPVRRPAEAAPETTTRSRAATGSETRVARPDGHGDNNTAVRNPRSGDASKGVSETTRRESVSTPRRDASSTTSGSTAPTRATTPSRSPASANDRQVASPSRSENPDTEKTVSPTQPTNTRRATSPARTQPAQESNRSIAPPTNLLRSTANPSREATSTASASSDRQSAPAPRVTRTQPQRSAAPPTNVQRSTTNSNRQATRTAPASSDRQSAPAPRITRTQPQQSPARSTESVRPSGNNNRSSGSTVQSSRPQSRQSATPDKNSSSSRSRNN